MAKKQLAIVVTYDDLDEQNVLTEALERVNEQVAFEFQQHGVIDTGDYHVEFGTEEVKDE